MPHDGSRRTKSSRAENLEGAAGLALFLVLASGEEDPSRVNQKLQKNAERRAKAEQKRLQAREARQERRTADKLADVFLLAAGANQARFSGIDLTVVPPDFRSDVASILAAVFSQVPISTGDAVGFPVHRLLETIMASGLGSAPLLGKAVRRAARRCGGEQKAFRQKQVVPAAARKIVWVFNDSFTEETKLLREQIRATRNRLIANEAQPVVGECPSRLIEATAAFLEVIGEKYNGLQHELAALSQAIIDIGFPAKRRQFVKLLLEKFLSIKVMPPDVVRDLFYGQVEWKEVENGE